MGEVVFIDSQATGDMDKVPAAVKEALSKQSGALPQVALSDAAGTKVYGTAAHEQLKGGLDKALRDAKKAMKSDQSGTPVAKPAATARPAASTGNNPEPAGDPKVTEKNGTKEVANAPLEQWTSSKGTSVTARLTKVVGVKVTLVTDAGKTVTLGQADLAPASYERLQEILTSR